VSRIPRGLVFHSRSENESDVRERERDEVKKRGRVSEPSRGQSAARRHGEVSDLDQDHGERPAAHGQPLLSRCERARAVPGAPALGQGTGVPTALPRAARGFLFLRLGTELRDPFGMSRASPPPRPQPAGGQRGSR